jgi:hypothetical protein
VIFWHFRNFVFVLLLFYFILFFLLCSLMYFTFVFVCFTCYFICFILFYSCLLDGGWENTLGTKAKKVFQVAEKQIDSLRKFSLVYPLAAPRALLWRGLFVFFFFSLLFVVFLSLFFSSDFFSGLNV